MNGGDITCHEPKGMGGDRISDWGKGKVWYSVTSHAWGLLANYIPDIH